MNSDVVEQVQALQARLLDTRRLEQLRISAVRGDLVVIHLMQVPKPLRRTGIGSQVLRDLTAAADRNDWILAGTPDASFGSSRTGLHRLYRRFGFTLNRGRYADLRISESLVRRPQPTATTSTSYLAAECERAAALEAPARRRLDRQHEVPTMTPGPRATPPRP